MGYPVGPVYRMLLLKGQRLNECAKLSWPEVHGDHIIVPASRMMGKEGKAREHLVPLTTTDGDLVRSGWQAERRGDGTLPQGRVEARDGQRSSDLHVGRAMAESSPERDGQDGGQTAPCSLIGLAPVRNPASTNKPGFCVSKVVVLFSRETRAFALQRRWELRLDHAGRCGSSTGTRNATTCARCSRSRSRGTAGGDRPHRRQGAPQDGGRAHAGRCARVRHF